MQIDCKGKYGKSLLLGTVLTTERIKEKCEAWAPKKAKSYTFVKQPLVDQHNQGNINVSYYTTTKEGKHLLPLNKS